MSSMEHLPRRDDPVRIVTETPGRHLRAFGPTGDGNDGLLAIARINPDGSGRWTVSTRGGRQTFDNEISARAYMLALLDDQPDFDPDAEDDGGDELVIR